MDAAPYIARIRRMLQDYTSTTRAGSFWSDYFIKLALNASQDIVVNTLLRSGKRDLLERLVSTFTGTGPVNLPANYLHYLSATVGDPARMARVYIGGEGYAYQQTVHDAAIVLGVQVWFIDRGDDTSAGVLHYYRRPNKILLTGDSGFTAAQDFDLSVYDLIARYAVPLLGIKETITARDAKNRSKVQEFVQSEAGQAVYYPVDRDAMTGGM